jgi:enoyl-CoA hydratase
MSMAVEERVGGDVLFERRGAVAWLTFNRPQSRNAMTFAMYDEIVKVCDELEADPDMRVLVLTGAGDKAFVAGTDISQFQTFTNPQHALEYEASIDAVITRLETFARPTIAAIRGYAVGGGASLAFACDMRYVTPDAKFGVPISRTLGNCLATNAYARMIDLIGPARTKELIFTASMVGAEDAKAIGLANEVVEPERLEERVTEVAEGIARNAPITIQVTKESVRRVLLHRRPERDQELILRAYMSEDFREGVRAFLDKRKPVWRGK